MSATPPIDARAVTTDGATVTVSRPAPGAPPREGRPSERVVVESLVGRQVGRYEVVREIGRGGMGVVYLARDASLRRDVALKAMLHGQDEHDRRRFLREAEAAAHLSHPYICKVYEVGEEAGAAFFTLELVDGLPLQRWMKERSPSRREVLQLFAKVCEAVAHAHLHGVIHRDLKPPNILVDERGDPRVLDFGIAKRIGAAPEDQDGAVTLQGTVIGTPSYMSPEQASGQPGEVDLRSDVYTLGVILYELLLGRLPFAAPSITQLLLAIATAEPPAPRSIERDLDWELEAIVLRAMEKQKAARYQGAAQLAEDVRRYLAGRPIEARKAGLAYRARKLVLRHRGLFAGLAVALSALCVAAFFAGRQWREARLTAGPRAQRLVREADELDRKARGLLARRDAGAERAAPLAAQARDKLKEAIALDQEAVEPARAARAEDLVALAGDMLREEAEAAAALRARAELAAAASALVAEGRRSLEAARRSARAVTGVADVDRARAALKEAETAFVQAQAKDEAVRGAEAGLSAAAEAARELERRRRALEDEGRTSARATEATLRGEATLVAARADATAGREEAAEARFREAIASAEEALALVPSLPLASALRIEAGAGLVELALANRRFYLASLAIDGIAPHDPARAAQLRVLVRDRRAARDQSVIELTTAEIAWADGRIEAAKAAYEKALALDPASAQARHGAAFTSGLLLRAAGDRAGALAAFERAALEAPGPRARAEARREVEATRAAAATPTARPAPATPTAR